MDFLERVLQLRDDYRSRQETAEGMVKKLQLEHDSGHDREGAIERVGTKARCYREFADEINRIL